MIFLNRSSCPGRAILVQPVENLLRAHLANPNIFQRGRCDSPSANDIFRVLARPTLFFDYPRIGAPQFR